VTAAGQPANWNPPKAESRVEVCELLPGLMEYEARQMIQKALGGLTELTIKHILKQTGNSMRRLAQMIEHMRELREINADHRLEDLGAVAGNCLLTFPH
jgi:hypothetical protein